MENVNVEVTEPGDQGLFGTDELWITVTGPDPLSTYPDLLAQHPALKGRDDLPARPFRYYPNLAGPGEPYSEMWVVKKQEPVHEHPAVYNL